MTKAMLRALAAGTVALALLSPSAAADEQADRDAAVAAASREAEAWLNAMDEHRYADAWGDAANVVKEGHSEQEWVSAFATPREAFGKTMMRELKRANFSTRVSGAPEGEYVTAIFLTQFANTPLALETVLLAREAGQWRIGGYDVAPASDGPPAPKPDPQPKTKE